MSCFAAVAAGDRRCKKPKSGLLFGKRVRVCEREAIRFGQDFDKNSRG